MDFENWDRDGNVLLEPQRLNELVEDPKELRKGAVWAVKWFWGFEVLKRYGKKPKLSKAQSFYSFLFFGVCFFWVLAFSFFWGKGKVCDVLELCPS